MKAKMPAPVIALARPPVCTAAAAAVHRRGGTCSRRAFVNGLFRVTAAGASLLGSMDDAADVLSAAPLSRSLSSAADGGQLARQGSLCRSASLRRSDSASASTLRELASNALPLDASRRTSTSMARGHARQPAALPLPPIVPPTQLPALQAQAVPNTPPADESVPSPMRRMLVMSLALQACPLGEAARSRPDADWVQQLLSAGGGDAAELALAAAQAGALLLCLGDSALHAPQAASSADRAEQRRAQLAAGVEARLLHYDCAAPATPGATPAFVHA